MLIDFYRATRIKKYVYPVNRNFAVKASKHCQPINSLVEGYLNRLNNEPYNYSQVYVGFNLIVDFTDIF